jgi:hypothetical protein
MSQDRKRAPPTTKNCPERPIRPRSQPFPLTRQTSRYWEPWILKSIEHATIVTGGFRSSDRNPTAVSTDVAALRGAQQFAAERNAELSDYFEACIPEPNLDRRAELGGVTRMNQEDGVTMRIMSGRTPLGRRPAMVRTVDVVITIAGRRHTEVVIAGAGAAHPGVADPRG